MRLIAIMGRIEFIPIELFEWPAADRYKVISAPTGSVLGEADDWPCLVADGKAARKNPLLMGAGALWAFLLAELNPDPQNPNAFNTQARKVAGQIGMLTKKSNDGDAESLREWLDFYYRLFDLAVFSRTRNPADFEGPIARAEIDLMPAHPCGADPILRGRPATLRDAILTAAPSGYQRRCHAQVPMG